MQAASRELGRDLLPRIATMWHHLREETLVERPLEEVFGFFSNAENLERITPKALSFSIVTPRPIAMHRGTLIDYELCINGIPAKWRTEITGWDPPHSFQDTQIKGPYRSWIHTHTFESVGPSRTLMRDHVRYRLPLYPFGELTWPLVALQVRAIFKFRKEAIQRELA